MAEEILGTGLVQILPVTGPVFTEALTAQMAASLSAINTAGTQNTLENAFAGGAAGAQALNKEVGAAAATITQKATPAIKAIGDESVKAGKAIDGASTSLGGMQRSILAVTKLAPLLVAAFSIKMFSDWEKAASEAAVVFGDSAQGVEDWANHLSTSFRLTSTAALRTATDIGNALEGVGFDAVRSATAAEAATQRVADIAAAQTKPVAAIATAFMLALEGNARGLKQLGIEASATDIKVEMLREGIKGSAANMSDAQRATVFYNLVMADTAKFQGEAAKTADTFAGKLGIAKATAGDAAKTIGEGLAPAAKAILGAFTDLIKPITALPAPLLAVAAATGITAIALNALSGSAVAKFVTGLFAADGAIGGLIASLGAADGAMATFGVVFEALTGPIGLISLALGAAVAIFATAPAKVDTATASLTAFDDIINKTGVDLKNAALADVAKAISDLGITGALDAAGISVKAFADGVLGGADGIQKMINQLIELHGEGKITDDQFGSLYDAVYSLSGQFGDATKKSADLAAAQKALDVNLGQSTAQIDAQTKAIDALFTVTDQLTAARKSMSTADQAVADAQQKVNDLVKIGAGPEIATATENLTQAHDSLTAALDRQKTAQEALDDLNAPATARELSDATDAVTLAQIAEAQATRAAAAAQKALNAATGEALNLTGLNLRQLGTALAGARASLDAVRATAPSSGATLQETAITAEINLRTAKEHTADAQTALIALQDKGKVETDATIAAENALVLAKNAVVVAQDSVNKKQAALDSVLAGNTQNAKDLKTAQDAVATAIGHQHDAQQAVSDLVAKQKDDTHTVLGDNVLITEQLKQQVLQHRLLFAGDPALRRSFTENFLAGLGATQQGAFGPGLTPGPPTLLAPGALTPQQIDAVFAALTGDPAKLLALLKSLGVSVAGFAEGGVITAPNLAWIGEKFKVESVIPWSNTQRVWEVLAKSLPHMTPTVRERIEPVIPNRPTISAPSHAARSFAEFDYDKMAKALARELLEAGVGAGDLNVYATPGMTEDQLVRKIKREMHQRWGSGKWTR